MKNKFWFWCFLLSLILGVSQDIKSQDFNEEKVILERPVPDARDGLWDDSFVFQYQKEELIALLKSFESQTHWKAFVLTQSFLDHQTATDFLQACREKWIPNEEGILILYLRSSNQVAVYQTEALRQSISPFAFAKLTDTFVASLKSGNQEKSLESLWIESFSHFLSNIVAEKAKSDTLMKKSSRNLLSLYGVVLGGTCLLALIFVAVFLKRSAAREHVMEDMTQA